MLIFFLQYLSAAGEWLILKMIFDNYSNFLAHTHSFFQGEQPKLIKANQ